MRRIILALSVAATMLTASCTDTYTVATTRNYDQTRTVQADDANVVVRPLTVDLQILSETKINDTWNFSQSETQSLGLVENIQLRAAYLSQRKHEADIIIAPLYSVTINANGTSTVVVTGFPAKYTNWRPFEEGDTIYRAVSGKSHIVKNR